MKRLLAASLCLAAFDQSERAEIALMKESTIRDVCQSTDLALKGNALYATTTSPDLTGIGFDGGQDIYALSIDCPECGVAGVWIPNQIADVEFSFGDIRIVDTNNNAMTIHRKDQGQWYLTVAPSSEASETIKIARSQKPTYIPVRDGPSELALPIMSGEGEIVGHFHRTGAVQLYSTYAKGIEERVSDLLQERYVYLISISAEGEKIAHVSRAYDSNNIQLVVERNNAIILRQSCRLEPEYPYRSENIILGEAKHTMSATIVPSIVRDRRGLALYFRGGPRRLGSYEANVQIVNVLAEAGFDVLIVDYAGTVGVFEHQYNGLRDRGAAALDSNLAVLREYVQSHYRKEEVVFVGVSAGAMAFVAANRNGLADMFDASYLIAPWIYPRHHTGIDPIVGGAVPDAPSAHVEEIFGFNPFEDFSWLTENQAILEEVCNFNPPPFVYIGSLDKSFKPADLGKCRDNERLVVYKKQHDFVQFSALDHLAAQLAGAQQEK